MKKAATIYVLTCIYLNWSCECKIHSRREKVENEKDLHPHPAEKGLHTKIMDPLANLSCGVAPNVYNTGRRLRIVGGRQATKSSWPWQVAVLNKYRQQFCGGTILNQEWVLTAAHCIRKKLHVVAGDHNVLRIEGTEQQRSVVQTFVYHAYDEASASDDVGLLKLKRPLIFNQHVQAACLPKHTETLEIGSRATIIGWGKRADTKFFGTVKLHQAEVPVVDIKKCRQIYGSTINNRTICAGFKRGGTDTCAGDSGGPLLYKKRLRWTVYGITNFGDGCGRKGKYAVYANVPKFVRWIKLIMTSFS